MSFNNNEFVLNPVSNRLIKNGGALHRRLLKASLLKKEQKKKPKTYKVQSDTDTSDYEPVKRPVRKPAPKKVIGKSKKTLQQHYDNMSDMSESDLSEMEQYIHKQMNKTKITESEPISEISESELSSE
jgi:hypothetical protein